MICLIFNCWPSCNWYIIVQSGDYFFHQFNTLMQSNAYIRQGTMLPLVQIMACRLFGAKPLSETMLSYCWLDHWVQTLLKRESKSTNFPSGKCIWKYRLQNIGHFISVPPPSVGWVVSSASASACSPTMLVMEGPTWSPVPAEGKTPPHFRLLSWLTSGSCTDDIVLDVRPPNIRTATHSWGKRNIEQTISTVMNRGKGVAKCSPNTASKYKVVASLFLNHQCH